MTVYFGFALSDSMFSGNVTIVRRELTPDEARTLIAAGVVSVTNPSHGATIDAMRRRYGLDVPVPATPPTVRLTPGDRLLLMAVRGLPRLTDRHQYTVDEIDAATFVFSLYEIVGPAPTA